MSAEWTGWSCWRRARSASAGGQLEQPSEGKRTGPKIAAQMTSTESTKRRKRAEWGEDMGAPWSPLGIRRSRGARGTMRLRERIEGMSEPAGIYISVPFCRAKCTCCNFASGVFGAERMDRYVERVSEEIAGVRRWAETNIPVIA